MDERNDIYTQRAAQTMAHARLARCAWVVRRFEDADGVTLADLLIILHHRAGATVHENSIKDGRGVLRLSRAARP